MACLSDDDIALFHAHALDPAGDARVRGHIAGCAACRELLAALTPEDAPSTIRDLGPPDGDKPGDTFDGKYKIERVLGEGTKGKVLAALHIELQRPVAIKIIHSERSQDAEAVRRLLREARAAATLTNKHIVMVYDFGRTRTGAPYIVMERLDGQHLGGRVLPVDHAIGYVLQVLEALTEAHARGIVHRDLKPQKLFVDAGGFVKVLDFGLGKELARVPEGESVMSAARTRMGTVDYLSPEQIAGEIVSDRSDVWSVGASLYALIEGRTPFAGGNPDVVCAKILGDPIPAMTRAPPAVAEVVMRCLSRVVQERPTSAQLASLLKAALAAPRIQPSMTPPPAVAPPPSASKVLPIALMVFASLATIGIAWAVVHRVLH